MKIDDELVTYHVTPNIFLRAGQWLSMFERQLLNSGFGFIRPEIVLDSFCQLHFIWENPQGCRYFYIWTMQTGMEYQMYGYAGLVEEGTLTHMKTNLHIWNWFLTGEIDG